MRQNIAHVICKRQWQLRVAGQEIRGNPLNISTGLSDDFKVAYNCILHQIT